MGIWHERRPNRTPALADASGRSTRLHAWALQNIILRRAVPSPAMGRGEVRVAHACPSGSRCILPTSIACRTIIGGVYASASEPVGRNGHRHGGGHERARRPPVCWPRNSMAFKKRATVAHAGRGITLTAEQRAPCRPATRARCSSGHGDRRSRCGSRSNVYLRGPGSFQPPPAKEFHHGRSKQVPGTFGTFIVAATRTPIGRSGLAISRTPA